MRQLHSSICKAYSQTIKAWLLRVTSDLDALHSKKNWSAQLGNLLVHSELTSLVHYLEINALLCSRLSINWDTSSP